MTSGTSVHSHNALKQSMCNFCSQGSERKGTVVLQEKSTLRKRTTQLFIKWSFIFSYYFLNGTIAKLPTMNRNVSVPFENILEKLKD